MTASSKKNALRTIYRQLRIEQLPQIDQGLVVKGVNDIIEDGKKNLRIDTIKLGTYNAIPGSGELDMLMPFINRVDKDLDICLPVVAQKEIPLRFLRYRPNDKLVPSIASPRLFEPVQD